MKTVLIVLGTVALATVLVVTGVWVGSAWAQGRSGGSQVGIGPLQCGAAGGGTVQRGMMGYGASGSGMMRSGRAGYGMMGGNQGGMPCQANGASGGAQAGMPCGANGAPGGVQQGMPCAANGASGGAQAGMPCGANGASGGVQAGMPCGGGSIVPGQGKIGTPDEAKAAVERYVQNQSYTGLQVKEVMEFERNYYAIVSETDTGTGAMELLVDKATGAVGPEQGPNMMWNAKYGMMARGGMMGRGRMMGGTATGEMTVSAAEAEQIAQSWLDANMPGRSAGEADPFYGYYTLHFQKDGKVDGMLSVHGSTGEVWYHRWHGAFVQMLGEEG